MAHHGEVLSLLGDIWPSLERVKLLRTLVEIAADIRAIEREAEGLVEGLLAGAG
ncbi:MAG: hypothetical protein VKM17_05845 [Cyanobacteriota bacterium]|nr:hypothetical protein [Cyanobacteriota bacterium]